MNPSQRRHLNRTRLEAEGFFDWLTDKLFNIGARADDSHVCVAETLYFLSDKAERARRYFRRMDLNQNRRTT